jgi:hypothetical protein
MSNTDYKVNNDNYSNKDLAEIFSPLSPFGIKIIYSDFWFIPPGSEDTPGIYSGWNFYGSGGRNDISGNTSFPGQVILYTGGSGYGVSGINYPYRTMPNEITFIFKLDNGIIQSDTLLYAGISTTLDNVSPPSKSAYIGVQIYENFFYFYGFIDGVVVTGPLKKWDLGSWYYFDIKIDKSQQEITFIVGILGVPDSNVDITVKNSDFDFDLLYYTLFEIRENNLDINLDYIGFSYQASRLP